MGVIETRAFKSGNSVAMRLPREMGIDAGTPLKIEKIGDHWEIRPSVDPAAEKRKVEELVSLLQALWVDAPDDPDRGRREPIDFPDRPGLY